MAFAAAIAPGISASGQVAGFSSAAEHGGVDLLRDALPDRLLHLAPDIEIGVVEH